MHSCKCQSFTDEGSRRLPKRLNHCVSVLASATNRLISLVLLEIAKFMTLLFIFDLQLQPIAM